MAGVDITVAPCAARVRGGIPAQILVMADGGAGDAPSADGCRRHVSWSAAPALRSRAVFFCLLVSHS